MLSKNCLFCGEEFCKSINTSLKEWNKNRLYCSRKCHYEDMVGKKQLEECIRKKIKYPRFFICRFCGKEIKNTDGTPLRKFCSQVCHYKYRLGKPGKKGQIAWNKGKKFPEKSGKNCHLWRGGIYKNKYPTNWTDDLKESIRKRDNYKCKICDVRQNELKSINRKLDIYHIDYDKNNLDSNNLLSLCRKCHAKINTNREYWKKVLIN